MPTLLRLEVRVSMPGLAAPRDSMNAESLSLQRRCNDDVNKYVMM